MAVFINDDCISCGACAEECPNTAIYAGGDSFSMAEGTKLADSEEHDALQEDFYFVVANKCTECVGFHDESACIQVCPVDAISKDPDNEESTDELQAKYEKLHG